MLRRRCPLRGPEQGACSVPKRGYCQDQPSHNHTLSSLPRHLSTPRTTSLTEIHFRDVLGAPCPMMTINPVVIPPFLPPPLSQRVVSSFSSTPPAKLRKCQFSSNHNASSNWRERGGSSPDHCIPAQSSVLVQGAREGVVYGEGDGEMQYDEALEGLGWGEWWRVWLGWVGWICIQCFREFVFLLCFLDW